MMKVILITNPEPIVGEVEAIQSAISYGVDRVHLRRPNWNEDQTKELLRQFATNELSKIVLHDHYNLANIFPIAGVHFNHRNPHQEIKDVSRSISCHSLEEVDVYADKVDYLFLSPIFDSISKPNYKSAWSLSKLTEITEKHPHKIVALGGITLERIYQLKNIKLYGIAILGDFWKATNHLQYLDSLKECISGL